MTPTSPCATRVLPLPLPLMPTPPLRCLSPVVLQVRSLSLSEDGPIIRRSLSEGAGNLFRVAGMMAPDPIAMLTDGTRKAMLSARSVIANAAGEAAGPAHSPAHVAHSPAAGHNTTASSPDDAVPGVIDVADAGCDAHLAERGSLDMADVPTLFTSAFDGEAVDSMDGDGPLGSDRSLPNESDHSDARTALAAPPASDSPSALYNNLIPILSKVTGATGDATHHVPTVARHHSHDGVSPGLPQSAEQLSVGQLEVVQETPGVTASGEARPRRAYVPAKSLRVPALRSSANPSVQALDLSQVKPFDDAHPPTRSLTPWHFVVLPPRVSPPPRVCRTLDSWQVRLPPLPAGARPGAASEGGGANQANEDACSALSFGSAHSAFTCWSSPSSSQLASPRPNYGMKATVSMPALTPKRS